MEFIDLVRGRRSVRAYSTAPVETEKLEYVLECGRLAPSACNNQPWRFIVIDNEEALKNVRRAYAREWLAGAPIVLAVCVVHGEAWVRTDGARYAVVDGAIAMDHMTLAATEVGLGTCWIGAFDNAEARRALSLPDHVELVALTPLGYPADKARGKSRKPLAEILFRNTFGGK